MRRTVAVLLAIGLLAAAGCGDDDDSDSGSNAPAPAETTEAAPPSTAEEPAPEEDSGGGGATTAVSLKDFEIDPAEATVQPGAVTFEISNDGQAPHALEIEGNGVEEVSDTLDSNGDTTTLEVDLEAGEYRWYCPVGNHAAMGMEGTLTVG
jgi:plastocyanin